MWQEEPVFIPDLEAYKKEEEQKRNDVSEEDIENMLAILDNFSKTETSRMNVVVSDEFQSGTSAKVKHHGRCDVGSPWAKGQAFDVLEDAKNAGCD